VVISRIAASGHNTGWIGEQNIRYPPDPVGGLDSRQAHQTVTQRAFGRLLEIKISPSDWRRRVQEHWTGQGLGSYDWEKGSEPPRVHERGFQGRFCLGF
jgi:hypothetical protein